MTHRHMLKEFYMDKKSIEYEKRLAMYVQMECLAETLCPKGKTIAEYFDWLDETKDKNYQDVKNWWEKQQESSN